tara:strand:- start:2513 stop:3853 length:1341 start_codon:yes stop_codon:yes gene_type:complete
MKKLIIVVFSLFFLFSSSVFSITLWTTETQPGRMEIQEELIKRFTAKTGIDVTLVPQEEDELIQKSSAAFAANSLPDIIFNAACVNFCAWAYDEGILDSDAATEIINSLGLDTYSAKGVLAMSEVEPGVYASVPSGAWPNATYYRKSIYNENGLAKPTNYKNILAGAKALHNPPDKYGAIVPTDVAAGFMNQWMETFSIANGLHPVKSDGSINFDQKKTIEVLETYKALVGMSPEGIHHWKNGRDFYASDIVPLTFWASYLLDDIAGTRDNVPIMVDDDPTSLALAKDTDVIVGMAGPSNPDGGTWVEVHNFAVTVDANTDDAQAFIEYVMNEEYVNWLGMAPEGSFPIRPGPNAGSKIFIEEWGNLPIGVDRKVPINQIYSQEIIESLINGLAVGTRWGASEGQLPLAAKLVNSGLMNRLMMEYINGDRTAEETVNMLNSEASKL